MEPDYARAFRIIRAAFGLKQIELAARMSISVSQLSLIEAGKRNATIAVIEALAKATKVPVELVELLAASREQVDAKSNREIAEASLVLLKLLVPHERTTSAPRTRRAG
jgi:transcriptional regulator with XRE-family HTH domain